MQNFRIITDGGMRGDGRIAPPGIWWKNPDLAQKIGLTADQQKKMDDVFQNSRIQLIDLKANVEKQEVTLEPLLDVNPIDAKRVLMQIGKVADARAELEKGNAAMLLGIRGVLTPDQWTKLRAEERNGRHGMMGNLNFNFDGVGFAMPDLAMLDGLDFKGLDVDLSGLSETLKNIDVEKITADAQKSAMKAQGDAMKRAQEALKKAQEQIQQAAPDFQ